MNLVAFKTEIQNCTNCELCNIECNKKDISKGFGKLYGWGGRKCRFLFLGMNPSRIRFPGHEYCFGGIEGSTGVGKKFNVLLKELNFYNDIFIDNLVRCSTLSNKINFKEAEVCFEHLENEIEILKPEKIITLGREVFSILNKLFEKKHIKISIANVLHPSYVFRYNKISLSTYKESINKVCLEER